MKRVIIIGLVVVAMSSTGAVSAASIDKNIYDPYTRADYPKTFATWGAKGVKRINAMRIAAAEKAAASSECDSVETADLSDNRSIPKTRIVIFVDCRNGKRFYIGENEVDLPAQSEETKMSGLSDRAALSRCEEALKGALRYPSTYDPDFGGKGVYRAPTTGNVVATIDFEAKNGFGNVIPQRAKCYFNGAGMEGPEIADR